MARHSSVTLALVKRGATSGLLEMHMHSDDMLRAALRRLLRATDQQPAGSPERRREVARIAGLNPDNLYQVASGVLLPSGAPRSVGRPMRLKLDAAFPDWLDGIGEAEKPAATSSESRPPTVRESLLVIRERLSSAAVEDRRAAAEALQLMAKAPDSDIAFEQTVSLLSGLK